MKLFTATGITGLPVTASDGEMVGTVVEALVTCADGTVSYVVIRSGGVGGIGETLRAVARSDLDFGCKGFTLHHERTWFEALPGLADGDWPAAPEAAAATPARS
jgi:sporulation protein YlmC with PRC-barrel domain